ncbi:MAG: ABC transporter permease [Chloroflexi bacterium]|nr:ABC transporter permease [Chloroflexota bacterium]
MAARADPLALAAARGDGPWRSAWRSLLRHRLAVFGLAVLAALVLVALLADVLAPYSYTQQAVSNARRGPSAAHWLGTDELGRDMLSRLMYGARVSLSVALVAQVLILAIGVPLGAAAGYFGGWVDTLVSRAIDVLYSFPDLLLIIIAVTSLRAALRTESGGLLGALATLDVMLAGLLGVFISLALVSWLTVARLVRGQVLSLKEREFVEAARAVGATGGRIVWWHLLPNALPAIVVAVTLGIPRVILVEAALSFVGIGVQAPTPSWGAMILAGANAARAGTPHLILGPAGALALTVLACNVVGDALLEAFDPWMRGSRQGAR